MIREKECDRAFNYKRNSRKEVYAVGLAERWGHLPREAYIGKFNSKALNTGKFTLGDMSRNMYNNALELGMDLSKEECDHFIETLYIDRSITGANMESKAIDFLKDDFHTVERAGRDLDTDFVDIVCKDELGEIIKLVQVKPTSYKGAPKIVHYINEQKEKKHDLKVDILYYDKNKKFEWN